MNTNINTNTSTKQEKQWLTVLKSAGVYYTGVVGAGFASGQEIMQFFTNFGTISLLALIPVTLLFGYFGAVFINMAHDLNTNSHGPIIQQACGRKIGLLIDWTVTFFMFGVFALMISGGGTVLAEYFSINPVLGRILVAVLSVLIVNAGFRAIVNFNGYIGPIIIVSLVAVSLIALGRDAAPITDADAILANVQDSAAILKGASNLLVSLFIYVAYCVTPNSAALAGIGKAESNKKTRALSGWAGGIALGVSLIVVNYVLLANYAEIYQKQLPLVELAVRIYQPLGIYFAVIFFLGVATTAITMLFGSVARMTEYGTSESKLCAWGLGIISLLIGLVPFAQLLNILYPILGYIGVVLMAAIVIYLARHKTLVSAACGRQ